MKTEMAIIALIVGVLALLVVLNRREARCLAYGYSSANTTMAMTTYCIKRVDQTDVVVRLDSLDRAK